MAKVPGRVGLGKISFFTDDTYTSPTDDFPWTALLTGASGGLGWTRESVDITNVTTVGKDYTTESRGNNNEIVWHHFDAGSVTPTPITFECSYNPDEQDPIQNGAMYVEIELPKLLTDTAGVKLRAKCHVSNFTVTDFFNFDGHMTCSVEVMQHEPWTIINATQV